MALLSFQVGEFARHVFTLMSGTLVAQAIPIAISPFLTRLYSPSEFGIFAIFTAVTAVLTVASTGRYELALNLPRSNLVASHLLAVAMLWTTVSATVVGLITWSLMLGGVLNLGWVYGLVPLSIIFSGFSQIFNYWLNREKRYKEIALSRAIQGAAFALVCITLGLQGYPEGMVLGFIAGQLACLSYLLLRSLPDQVHYRSRFSKHKMLRTAARYRDFPRLLIFAHSLNMASSRLPTLMMPISFGPALAGFYGLTQQVIGLPMQLVGGAIGDVFRQQASVEFRTTGSCRRTYVRTLKVLVALYVLPFLILLFFSPLLFSWVFGAQWRQAGVMAQILSPMFYMQFISSPLSSMFMIAEKQREDLVWQITLFALTAASLVVGWKLQSIEGCIAMFSASYSVMYAVNIYMTHGFSKPNN